jgi:hypothetical protein
LPNLNTVKTNQSGISLNIQQAEERLFKEVTDGSRRPFQIPTITTINNRTNVWAYNWAAGESWTNYHNYLTGAGEPDMERAFWYSLGTNNRQNTLSYSAQHPDRSGRVEYAINSVAGGESQFTSWSNNTSYGPMRFRTLFLRNFHPTLTKSVTMYGHYSNYWSAGYEGSGVTIGTPNTQNYAGCTRVNWSVPVNRSSGNSYYTWSWNVSIPPLRTVAVVQANSMWFWTSSSGQYVWGDINKFYDLHTTFNDFWVQPDLKMTHAAATYNDHDNQFNSYTAHKIWNRTSQLFGDR